MVTCKILNPERLKKVKGNQDTLALRVTCYSFSSSLLCTSSLSMSEILTPFQDKIVRKLSTVERG